MAGSHRNAEDSSSKLLRAPVIAIAVGLVLLLVFVVWTVAGDDTPGTPPTSTPVTTSAPVPTTSPTTSMEPVPVSPIDDLPRIPGAPPQRLVIGDAVDVRFANAITSEEGLLEAPTPDRLARLEDRGEPGSPGEDTVILVGQDRFDQQAALNDIADVAKDDELVLETRNARLTYTVDSIFKVGSESTRHSTLFRDVRPGRLLLIATTYDADGERTGADTVVVARLTDAERA